MTHGVAQLFNDNGVVWVKGTGTFKDALTIDIEGREEVAFKSAVVATGSQPILPAIDGLGSNRCVDSEGLLGQTEVPERLAILGGGVIGCEFASIFQRFGSEATIIEQLPQLIAQEDEDASKELARQFRKRGVTLELGKECTRVEDSGSELTIHFGQDESVRSDLMLVAVGRRPLVDDVGLENIGVEIDSRRGVCSDQHRRTTVPHIYAVGDCAGYWQLAHTAFREGEVAAMNAAAATRSWTTAPFPARSTPTPRSRALAHRDRGARAARRRCPRREVPVASERAGRDAERDRRLGQVDPRDALRGIARSRHGRAARDGHGRGRRRCDRP